MKIYTKTGDKGETSLFGGERVWKDNHRICAYGTVDELNALLGLTVIELNDPELKALIESIQNDLFTIGSDLATPNNKGNKGFVIPRVEKKFVEKLESSIDRFDSLLPELRSFILPGGIKGASYLHLARTVCRRAEREVIALAKVEEINPEIGIYLNRLSDLLFVLARYNNHISKHPDIEWKK
jgi:cob(I)alamin adenosyltransferase